MSITARYGPLPGHKNDPSDRSLYRSACWIRMNLKVMEGRLLRMVLVGAVRVRTQAGLPPTYSLDDIAKEIEHESGARPRTSQTPKVRTTTTPSDVMASTNPEYELIKNDVGVCFSGPVSTTATPTDQKVVIQIPVIRSLPLTCWSFQHDSRRSPNSGRLSRRNTLGHTVSHRTAKTPPMRHAGRGKSDVFSDRQVAGPPVKPVRSYLVSPCTGHRCGSSSAPCMPSTRATPPNRLCPAKR